MVPVVYMVSTTVKTRRRRILTGVKYYQNNPAR
jgi:hypothetical protein